MPPPNPQSPTPSPQTKSSVSEIRHRFDNDVARFSVLQTGQSSTVDAPLVLDLITSAAATTNPNATHILDIGCGAGNYTLKLLEKLPQFDATLIDLSQPMLEKATERITSVNTGKLTAIQSDVRELDLGEEKFDIIMAAAVLHHLRTDNEWLTTFQKFHRALKPNGSLWISDLVEHTLPNIQAMMYARYGDYLTNLKDEAYRDHVYAYIAKEDSPRPVMFQIDTLRKAGFETIEFLHKNSCFAAFGAVK